MEGASCNPPGLERTLPSLELKQQPMSGEENKPPSKSLRTAPGDLGRRCNSQQEQQGSSTFLQEQPACSTSNSSRVHPPRRPLRPLTINLPSADTPASGQQPCIGGGVEDEESQIPASVFQFPPPFHHNPPFHHDPCQKPPFHHQHQHQAFPKKESPVTCVVEQEGHLCLKLRYERGCFL